MWSRGWTVPGEHPPKRHMLTGRGKGGGKNGWVNVTFRIILQNMHIPIRIQGHDTQPTPLGQESCGDDFDGVRT